ncbi:hypothetical protein [Flavobacterium subsaxonicum]|uniref:Uncharacterized protein n=1 Tax=Flavobacterium subsaxonicum WB 4.1-42 = DSM 21790 TaxID=1121898 RepID=A0A0A2MQA2_9FLAO|nr:hypothetical protein [Flavobacterium subsaxonicum]KGO93628.1 hypothetical protein Q766_06600 [Flavobacterium subsaxonicum WB 4.1-42 = DSM 21790]
MRFINTNDLELWANTVDCKCHLPHLILKKWVDNVRALAVKNFRVRVTEDSLAKFFAKYPVDMAKGKGYPEAIYDIREEGSEAITLSFRIHISNNPGFTSRAASEGTGIKKGNAQYINSLSK